MWWAAAYAAIPGYLEFQQPQVNYSGLEPPASVLEIVGGTVAPDAELFPGVVALYGANENLGCTGVLIAPDLVLTAGHCGGAIRTAAIGVVDRDDPTDRVEVIETLIHPDYFSTFDVAVMRLAEDLGQPSPALVDCDADVLEDGLSTTIVGYGSDDEDAVSGLGKLRSAAVPIVDHDCSDFTRGCNPLAWPDGELIAGGDGVDSCKGDSGGPLYVSTEAGFVLAAITSRGAVSTERVCGDGGIYVRVDAIWEWIEQEMAVVLEHPQCEGINRRPAPAVVQDLIGPPGSFAVGRVTANDLDETDTHTFVTEFGSSTDGTVVVPLPWDQSLKKVKVTVSDGELHRSVWVDVTYLAYQGQHAGCTSTPGPKSTFAFLVFLFSGYTRRRWRIA